MKTEFVYGICICMNVTEGVERGSKLSENVPLSFAFHNYKALCRASCVTLPGKPGTAGTYCKDSWC